MDSVTRQYRIFGSGAREIADSIEHGVDVGALRPGQRLPSVRLLAQSLGVSPPTVSAAYAQLQRRGVVVSRNRSGTHIRDIAAGEAATGVLSVEPGTRDLASGNPDPALLPRVGDFLAGPSMKTKLYGEPSTLPLLGEVARSILAEDGIPSEDLAVTSGALDAIERALVARLSVGDQIAVEDPCYPPVLHLCRALGLSVVPLALDDEGPLPDRLQHALSSGARALVVTPRAQNPTGAAVSARRSEELGAVLSRYPDVLVIVDDHVGALAGADLHPIAADQQRWVYVRSFAKGLGPDLRVAIVSGDRSTIRRVEGRQQLGYGWVSHLLQSLVVRMWTDESVQLSLQHAAVAYRERRTSAVSALAASGVTVRGKSGFNVWIPVQDEGSMARALHSRGWAVTPGRQYRVDSGPGLRVTTASLLPGEAAGFAAALSSAFEPTRFSRSG